jgi:hypothetical protein
MLLSEEKRVVVHVAAKGRRLFWTTSELDLED